MFRTGALTNLPSLATSSARWIQRNTTGVTAKAVVNTVSGYFDALSRSYAHAGHVLTKISSGVHEVGVKKTQSERDIGRPPYFLTKKDHFIRSLDDRVDLLLGEISFDPEAGAIDNSNLVRTQGKPALLFTHGMFMNANFGLFSIDGRGRVPNLDTIRTFLGFFAYLGFPVFYLHQRNCVHIQNGYIRHKSRYVTDPNLRPDLKNVHYQIPPNTTLQMMAENDIGAALKFMVEKAGYDSIVAMAHSLGGDILFDYYGRHLPYSENIAALIPICTPFRWQFGDEELIKTLIRINNVTSAINTFLETAGSDERTHLLAFMSDHVRQLSEIMAGFLPLTDFGYRIGTHLPVIKDALGTLRYAEDGTENVTSRTIGKFLRKCIEPMSPLMIDHFMRVVQSPTGHMMINGDERIADLFPEIDIPVFAVAGTKDGLADPERNILPDFNRLASREKVLHRVPNGDHFTTLVGKKAPLNTWLEIARWLHEIGYYPEFDEQAIRWLHQDHIA